MASFKLKDKNGNETTYNKSGIKIPNASGTGYVEFSEPIKLNTPTISISNDVVSWSAITSATGYVMYKDNALYAYTDTTSISDIEAVGTYKVKAVASDYTDSSWSNSIIVTLPKPSDLTGTQWVMNRFISWLNPLTRFSVNATVNWETSGSSYSASTDSGYSYIKIGPPVSTGAFRALFFGSDSTSGNGLYMYYDRSIVDASTTAVNNVVLTITGGSAATNSTLIDYLWNNATRIA